MIPLSDSAPRVRFPFINYLLILANIYVFYLQLTSPDFEAFIVQWAFIPANFSLLNPVAYLPLFAGIFMHGGFLHIISNLWILHVFGDNVEDYLGHFRFLVFYLLCGLAASLAQYFVEPDSVIPLIGASGAISGVMGAYFDYYRHHTVKTLIPLGFFYQTANLPSWIFLGYWFVLQLFSGAGSLSSLESGQGGVAWFAHIGGFLFGYLTARVLQ
jgi:hypothetical protein